MFKSISLLNVLSILLVIISVVITRVLPHPYNFTPMAAVAVFSGARNGSYFKGLIITLSSLIVSDVFVMYTIQKGYGTIFQYLSSLTAVGVYVSFSVLVLLGYLNRFLKFHYLLLALISSLLFYFLTNFFVWLQPNSGYPPSLSGLLACLWAGVPFYKSDIFGSFFFNQVFGDLFYFNLLFIAEYLINVRFRTVKS